MLVLARAIAVRTGPFVGESGWLALGAIQTGSGMAVYGFLTWLIGRRGLRLSWHDLGWVRPAAGVPGFGKGLGTGLVIGAVAVALGVLTGSAWSLDGGTFAAWVARVGALAVVLLPAAFMEELAFRGVAIAGMAEAVGRGPAVVATAVLFGVVHYANPEVTPLALGNIALAGVFLGLTFFARGGLWTATGAHLGWNLALAALAAPVSGLPFTVPWIDLTPGRPDWLSGGAFGPEGGILATMALAAGTVLVLRWRDFKEES